MISVETMRVVLTAAKLLLQRCESRVSVIECDIKMREDTVSRGKSVGARTRAQGEVAKLQYQLAEARAQVNEVYNAINELRATEVGAQVWK